VRTEQARGERKKNVNSKKPKGLKGGYTARREEQKYSMNRSAMNGVRESEKKRE
jgi:hypothetical protein